MCLLARLFGVRHLGPDPDKKRHRNANTEKTNTKSSWTVFFDGSDFETRYITVAKALLIFYGNNCDEKTFSNPRSQRK